jgi:hypothetical protein
MQNQAQQTTTAQGTLPYALLTIAETAAHLGLNRKRVAALRDSGQLPCVWLSESRCRFRSDVVAAFGRETQTAPPQEQEPQQAAALARGHEIAWLRETAALHRQIAERFERQADALESADSRG